MFEGEHQKSIANDIILIKKLQLQHNFNMFKLVFMEKFKQTTFKYETCL